MQAVHFPTHTSQMLSFTHHPAPPAALREGARKNLHFFIVIAGTLWGGVPLNMPQQVHHGTHEAFTAISPSVPWG